MNCSICQEQIDVESNVTLPCNHQYCQECILSWTAGDSPQRGTCPVCREPVAPRFETEETNFHHRRIINSAHYAKMQKVIEAALAQHEELRSLHKLLQKDVERATKNHSAARERLKIHNKVNSKVLRRHRDLQRLRWKRSSELYNARSTMLDMFPVTNIFRVTDGPTRTEGNATTVRRSTRIGVEDNNATA